jgi:hypothetical protein
LARETRNAPRETVEDCRVLDVFLFAREGYLREGARGTCSWSWPWGDGDSLRWQVRDWALHLAYTIKPILGEPESYSYPVRLDYTPATYGGARVWFLCPHCNKRVSCLYLPPSGGRFLCRTCHDLTYRACQRRVSPWERVQQLERDLHSQRLGSKRWHKLLEKQRRLLATLATDDLVLRMKRQFPKAMSALIDSVQEAVAAEAARERRRGPPPRERRPYQRRKPFMTGQRASDKEGLCLRCRAFRKLRRPRPVTLSNGRPALRGTCPVCGARMMLIVKKSPAEPPDEGPL